MTETNLYLDVVKPLNSGFIELMGALESMDTRVFHIRSFASRLSMAMPSDLWTNELYKAQLVDNPLPADPFAILDYDTFQSWITVYEMIMRSVGLIGTTQKADNSYLAKYFGLDMEAEDGV